MVFEIADMNFGLGDMNSYTHDAVCTRKGGVWEGRPVKIITDNSIETIVLWDTEMNNDSLDVI